jgi:transposase-like protein
MRKEMRRQPAEQNQDAPQPDKALRPSVEAIQAALSEAKNLDDFFGKEGILAQLFARTIEQMLEGEVTDHLGYEKYEAKGRNSGNSRNGKRRRGLRTSAGEVEIAVPRDRNGDYQPQVLGKYQTKTNELEDKIIAMYAQGTSTHDIEAMLRETYGVNVSAGLISTITDKVWPLVEAWQNRPLSTVYPIIYLDAMYIKLRREGKVAKIAVYSVLGVDLDGHRDVLGHWLGDGAEGANFWLSVLSDLQGRGVEDVFIACVDGLTGFQAAIEAVFPQTQVQRCIVHQIRNSLKYVVWKDRKAFMVDLKKVYQASTREQAETQLLQLGEVWGHKYAMAVRSWENNWDSLSTFFDYPEQIRRLIYTTNAIEGYHRQLRKVTKTKGAFPTDQAVRKLLYLATERLVKKWTVPLPNWALIRNQLAIRVRIG